MITVAEGKKQSAILEAEARSSEMEIDANARAKQTQIDAEARANRMKIDADAEANKIAVLAEADKNRILTVNNAVNESKLTPESLNYLGLQAFKEVVNSKANTVIIPNNMTDVANVPVIKQLWDKAETPQENK
jgi:regulator of protease activity HflC (stomatin/prohibitin superfamily)